MDLLLLLLSGLYAWQRMQLECRPGRIFYTDEGNLQSGQIVLFDNDRGGREREREEGRNTDKWMIVIAGIHRWGEMTIFSII